MRHPETGVILRRDVRPYRVFYGEASEVILAAGWFPEDPADENGVFAPADCKVIERSFNRQKAKCEGLLSAEEVKRIRKKLRLNDKIVSQRLAGEILGGGPNAFQKYEASDIVIARSMDGLLRLLDERPDDLLRLPGARLRQPLT